MVSIQKSVLLTFECLIKYNKCMNKTGSSCCGCLIAFVLIALLLVLIAAFAFSKIFTINEMDSKFGTTMADQEGILYNFDATKYKETDTFRSIGLDNWKLWDVFVWIIKSGNYTPSYAN